MRDAGIGHGRNRIAATCDGKNFSALGQISNANRHFIGGFVERRRFKGAKRPVPDNRLAHIERFLDFLRRSRADIEDHLVGGDRIDIATVCVGTPSFNSGATTASFGNVMWQPFS